MYILILEFFSNSYVGLSRSPIPDFTVENNDSLHGLNFESPSPTGSKSSGPVWIWIQPITGHSLSFQSEVGKYCSTKTWRSKI